MYDHDRSLFPRVGHQVQIGERTCLLRWSCNVGTSWMFQSSTSNASFSTFVKGGLVGVCVYKTSGGLGITGATGFAAISMVRANLVPLVAVDFAQSALSSSLAAFNYVFLGKFLLTRLWVDKSMLSETFKNLKFLETERLFWRTHTTRRALVSLDRFRHVFEHARQLWIQWPGFWQ